MPALLSLLGPFIAPLLIAIGAIVAFFGYRAKVKNEGVQQERARQVKQQEKVTAQVAVQVKKAESKDTAVDQKVQQEVQQIETKPPESPKLDPSKLRVGDDIDFKF